MHVRRLWLERNRSSATGLPPGSVQLEVDHIKRFSVFVELRFTVDNGRTLCAPCHRKTKTYGFTKALESE